MLILNYDFEMALECEPKVKECCVPEKKPGEPAGSGDCCYDTWTKEYKVIESQCSQAEKKVTHLTERLTSLENQRDMWKGWKTELDAACILSNKICTQLEILLHHLERISHNLWLTKKAINLLNCMLRDFYMQIDLLKKKYDYLMNCIGSISSPVLAKGQGLMILVEDYGTKLDAVITTRDKLIELVFSALSGINNINKNIGYEGYKFGMQTILAEWKKVFNCDCRNEPAERIRYEQRTGERYASIAEGEFEDIGLNPTFGFPICDSWYYKMVEDKYKDDSRYWVDLHRELQDQIKKRDSLVAHRDGLKLVMEDKDINPTQRCATTATK